MEIKRKYKATWVKITQKGCEEGNFLNINPTFFKNPFDHLPSPKSLSKKEAELLKKLERQDQLEGYQMLDLLQLWEKKGRNAHYFKEFTTDLYQLISTCKEESMVLPAHFISFFNNQEYISRFRTRDLTFFLHELSPFPEDKNLFILPFFGDSQGFCWWYLLLDKKGNHCILYNTYRFKEKPDWNLANEPPQKYIICAHSFGEFIVRLSIDLKIMEGEEIHF